MSGSQDQKEMKTTSTVKAQFSEKKTAQRKFASVTIASPVDLLNALTMKTSR